VKIEIAKSGRASSEKGDIMLIELSNDIYYNGMKI